MSRNWVGSLLQDLPLFWKFACVFLVLAVAGLYAINVVLPDGSSEMLPISVQYLAAAGTLSLAAGTFYNIQQTNQDLKLRKQQREKPLAIDELSNIITPAIQAVSENIELLEGEQGGVNWAYLRGPASYRLKSQFRSAIPSHDVAALHRLNEENRELYQKLVKHDDLINQMASISQEVVSEMKEPIKEKLRSEGYEEEDYSQSERVFISAGMKELNNFGENHEMFEFWENNREDILNKFDEEVGQLMLELEDKKREYENLCEGLEDELRIYQANVQRRYGISSEEISQEDPFEGAV